MANFITSANAIYTMTIQDLFSAPVTLKNWASDNSFEQSEVELTETAMSIDGVLNAGFVPRPVPQTLNFSPASESLDVMDAIWTTMQQTQSPIILGASIYVPSTSKRYTFVRGVMTSASVAPNGGTVLGNRQFSFIWERVFPAGV